jgi:thiol-disulfide isomerase/thioredoxin
MRYLISFSILLVAYVFAYSQCTITGTFSGMVNQQIRLMGFDGFNSYVIDSVKTNDNGVFNVSYGKKDFGMGYLAAEDHKPFFVVLNGEPIRLTGQAFALPESIEFLDGTENRLGGRYAAEHPRREQALSAWGYLENIYKQDPLFSAQQVPRQAIANEKQRIKSDDSLFLAGLDAKTYIRWYLPVRKLASSVSTIAQYRTAEMPAAVAAFRKMDYTDPRLYKSGLLGEVIDGHFWLLENSGRPLDSVYVEMMISIDHMIENLLSDEQKLNEITEYVFKLLEKRSLFGASEYLALKLLNTKSCAVHSDLASQLESYRAMKKGALAPDFEFKNDVFAPGYVAATQPHKLSDLKSKYIAVIFGASWCPQCPQELSRIARLYGKWKKQSVDVVFISLDDDAKIFKNFVGVMPFISICDYGKWESPLVKAYHVFATPTMYLLDDKREILLRPGSVGQLDSWVDWYLIKGNK